MAGRNGYLAVSSKNQINDSCKPPRMHWRT